MDTKPLYIFLHIRKTGGSTLRSHARANLRPEQFLFADGLNLSPSQSFRSYWHELLDGRTAEMKNDLVLIGGHAAYYGLHEHFPGRQPYYITVFRQPGKLILSWYNYCIDNIKLAESDQRIEKWRNLINPEGKIATIGSILQSSSLLDNLLLRSLYDFFHDARTLEFPDTMETDQPAATGEICQRLREFSLIGCGDNISADLNCVYGLLGFNSFHDSKNVSSQYAAFSGLPKSDKALLSKASQLDQTIIAAARQLSNSTVVSANWQRLGRSARRRKLAFAIFRSRDYFSDGLTASIYALSARLKSRFKPYAVLSRWWRAGISRSNSATDYK